MISFELRERPEPICGAISSTRKNAIYCELPPGHLLPDAKYGSDKHRGRNQLGAWRSWNPKPDEKYYDWVDDPDLSVEDTLARFNELPKVE